MEERETSGCLCNVQRLKLMAANKDIKVCLTLWMLVYIIQFIIHKCKELTVRQHICRRFKPVASAAKPPEDAIAFGSRLARSNLFNSFTASSYTHMWIACAYAEDFFLLQYIMAFMQTQFLSAVRCCAVRCWISTTHQQQNRLAQCPHLVSILYNIFLNTLLLLPLHCMPLLSKCAHRLRIYPVDGWASCCCALLSSTFVSV